MRNAQILRSLITGAAALAFTCSVSLGQSDCGQGAQDDKVAQINSKEGPPAEKIKKSKLHYEKLVKAGMPVMEIKVGKKTTTCVETAFKLAKKLDTKPVYTVDETTYESWDKAGKAYAEQLDGFLKEIVTVQYSVGKKYTDCPETAQKMSEKSGNPIAYQVTGRTTDCEKTAGKYAKTAMHAAKGVNLMYLVGEEKFDCPKTAGKYAKKTEQKIVYIVAGEKTKCDVQAEVNLAMARIQAALSSQEDVITS